MTAGPLAMIIRARQLVLQIALVSRRGHEDDLTIGGLGHCLHGLEIADLHRRCARQDIGRLAHEFGRLDFGAGGDDFGLANPFGLCGHGQRVLQFGAEDDVFDEHALDLNAPAGRDGFDDLADRLGHFLATLDHVLENAGADDVPQRGLSAFDEGLADVGDAEGGFVGRGDVILNKFQLAHAILHKVDSSTHIDHRGEMKRNVVLGHANLLGDLCASEVKIMVGCTEGGGSVPTIWILTST